MGNYVIRVGNYVTAKAPSLGNSVIVDSRRRVSDIGDTVESARWDAIYSV
jgi:hypothetical protein